MSPELFFILDEVFDDEEEEVAAGALAILAGGAVCSRLERNERRREHRRYLTRLDLLPNPRVDTPWQALYHSRNDRAFITTMGFDVDTFEYILESGFEERWNNTPIPREDVSSVGAARVDRRSLDAAGALGLALHYLASSMREVHLQLIFALTPTTASRYLEHAQEILYQVVREIPEGEIRMPKRHRDFQHLNDLIVARHPQLTGAFGSVDGLSLISQTSDDPEIENATYNAWISDHCINNIFVFSPEGVIIMCVLNAPGSWHDTRVARTVFEYLRDHVPDGFYLCADSGFPKGTAEVAGKIQTPLRAGQRVSRDPIRRDLQLKFNRDLVSYRQTAEWGMRMIQGSFGRLRVPLVIGSRYKRTRLLETCSRLLNIRARRVGINQIRSVYIPIWRASEDERLWDNLGDMIFGDIRRKDRVSRFHLVLEDN